MSSIAISQSFPARRWTAWVIAGVIALLAVGVTWFVISGPRGGAVASSAYHTISPISMEVTVTKDGELQAVSNQEIVCPVEGQSVIQSIVKEGTTVKKGDVIAVIETTDLQTKMETATLDVQKAEADLTTAKEGKEIQESTNVANLEAANVELVLARLDLEEYTQGTFPKLLASSKRDVEMARISVKTKEQDLAQQQSLFAKGFVNASDVKTAEINLIKEQNNLATVEADLNVLEKYTYEKESTDRKNKVAQAEKKLVRVQRENMSNLAQKLADYNAKEQTLTLRKRQLDNLKVQLAAATIKAPADGLVVYGSSGGWGRRDTPIQAGANVRFQETLIRLPDTSRMKAVARIQESQVAKLRVDPTKPMRAVMSKISGMQAPIGGWLSNISVMADSGSGYRWNPDSKEYPVDVTLDSTPVGLKPGMTTEVKIYVERVNEALAVPLPALYTAGPESFVFMRDGEGHKPVKVKLGAVNDTHAQIAQGVNKGDQVLLLQAGQGRELLEKAGIKIAPATRPSVVDDMPPIPVDRGPAGPGGANGASGNGPSRGQGMSNGSTGGENPTTNPSGAGGSRRRRSTGGDGGTGGTGGDQRPPTAVTPAPAS